MGKILTDHRVVEDELGLSSGEFPDIVNRAINSAEAAVLRYLRYDPVQRTRTEYYPLMSMRSNNRRGIWEVDDTSAYWRREVDASSSELQLKHLPLRSVTTLHIDTDGRFGKQSGAFGSETLKTEGTDYWPRYDGLDDSSNEVCSDGILLSHGRWPDEPGSVKVVYVAGYTAGEFTGTGLLLDATAIYSTVLEETARRVQKSVARRKTASGLLAGPITGERLGDYSYQLDSSSVKAVASSSHDLTYESKERLQHLVNWGIET